jgi:hypothetical protein
MGRHYEIHPSHFFPKQGCSEVNGIESTKFSRHGLSCSIEDSRSYVHDL